MFKLDTLFKARPRRVKARSQYFIKNQGEPRDNHNYDSLAKDETVLVENSPIMRRRFRHIAQRIRIINIYGIKKSSRKNSDVE